MQIEQITKDFNGSGSMNSHLPKGHMNGLLLSIKPNTTNLNTVALFGTAIANLKLSVKYVTDTTIHLVPNLPLLPFVALSDQNFGYGSITKSYQAITDTSSSEDELDDKNASSLLVYIELGSIFCENGDEVYTILSGLTTDLTVNAYAVSQKLDLPTFIKYDLDQDFNENHQNIHSAYIFSEGFDPNNQIIVESDLVNYSTDINGIKAVTSLFTQLEDASYNLFRVFTTQTGLPTDLWIRMNGATQASANAGVFTIRIEAPEKANQIQKNVSNKLQASAQNSIAKNISKVSSVVNTGLAPIKPMKDLQSLSAKTFTKDALITLKP